MPLAIAVMALFRAGEGGVVQSHPPPLTSINGWGDYRGERYNT